MKNELLQTLRKAPELIGWIALAITGLIMGEDRQVYLTSADGKSTHVLSILFGVLLVVTVLHIMIHFRAHARKYWFLFALVPVFSCCVLIFHMVYSMLNGSMTTLYADCGTANLRATYVIKTTARANSLVCNPNSVSATATFADGTVMPLYLAYDGVKFEWNTPGIVQCTGTWSNGSIIPISGTGQFTTKAVPGVLRTDCTSGNVDITLRAFKPKTVTP